MWQSDPAVFFHIMEHATTYCNVNSTAQFPAAIRVSSSATHFRIMLSTPQLAKICFLLGVFKNRVPLHVTSVVRVSTVHCIRPKSFFFFLQNLTVLLVS
jgi:hypothetical protein